MISYKEERAKTYQVPKTNHPWRRYKNRIHQEGEEKEEKKIKSVKLFVSELIESWETAEVVTMYQGTEGSYKLSSLPQGKQAAWLASFLKRNYG